MTPQESFAELMDLLRGGQDAAAEEVLRRFTGQLIALARGQLRRSVGHRADPEDVVQSALASFLVRHREGGFAVPSWNSLWKLLALITLRKCADRVEYFRAGRRDSAREAASEAGWRDAIDREPTPLEAAQLAETVEQLLRDLDADERPILELSLQGYSTQEISERLGRAERTVRRLRERVRKRLERMQQAG
jgi:RNA polymerase sigma-70 factor, ECF subfamily